MTHTLEIINNSNETIYSYINKRIRTAEDYSALPQDVRELYEQELERQMAWDEECARADEEEAKRKEQARLQAVWDAVDNGSSSSPSGAW